MASSSGVQSFKETERNFPLNVQSFVPFALSQQQLQIHRQQQQQQQQPQPKFRLPQFNLDRGQSSSNDYNSNDEDEYVVILKLFYFFATFKLGCLEIFFRLFKFFLYFEKM